LLAVVGSLLTGDIVGWLGLSGGSAVFAEQYLGALYVCQPALALALIVEFLFLARGRTVIPMLLQALALALNWIWTPMLTYGARAAEVTDVPGAGIAAGLARLFGVEGGGMAGAAWATGLARLTTGVLGLAILAGPFGVAVFRRGPIVMARLARIVKISVPVSLSVLLYAGVYWAILGLVLSELPDAVTAGLGLGFQVFEGLAYPAFLGIGMACASLVGRHLGARDERAVFETIQSARFAGRILGVAATVAFLVGGSLLGPIFTKDEAVLRELLLYVTALAFSQYWVAVETVNERVLLGAGHTRSIPWISAAGNLLRVPLAWLLALELGLGGPGVWWAINATTWLKAWLFWREVRKGRWFA
jgi:multidrug resistance protein, MATE family